jgi:diguanylate cyclase
MADAAAEHQWKDRYRELLRDFETKEREWVSLEKALRAAAGKLTMAAMGQSTALDMALGSVADALRGKGTAAELDTGMSAVVRQLHVHDATTHNIPKLPDLPKLLGGLIRSLGRFPGFDEATAALAQRLPSVAPDGWAAFLDEVANQVGAVAQALRKQRADLEDFLEQVTRQLALLEGFTSWQVSTAKSRRDDSRGLERSVEEQIGGLHRDVEEAGDVTLIKVKVQSRLSAVANALHQFRVSEEKRDAENEQRAAELSQEVLRLKVRTSELTEICAAQETKLMLDSLTGAHSRYAYEQRLAEEHQRWQRHGQPLCYAIFDIDRFKSVNDQLGHDAGDRLLRAVVELLTRHKRSEDFLARLGGEEFALLLPMTALDASLAVANKLREAVEGATFQHKGKRERVTISCGVTEFRVGDTPSVVYDRADRALYRAKEEGRNRCVAD